MFDPMFIPPRDNPFFVRVATTTLPLLLNLIANVRDVRVRDEDMAHLEAVRPTRALLSPNHPTGNDPFVLMWLSRLLRQPFNYLAAREALDGLKGWFMNQAGAYSVIRGAADRESLRATRRLLAEQDRKVVIFPEGEIYEHNDMLLDFQSGVAQIGFWALDDVTKLGKDRVMPIVPVAFKYRCCDSPRQAIESGLRALEDALDLPPAPKSTAYARLLRIGGVMTAAVEQDLGIKPAEDVELPDRIQEYRQRLMDRVAQAVGAKVAPELSPADQLHALFHDLKEWVGELPESANAYQERLYRRRVEVATPLFQDLQRLRNFISVTGDYVRTDPTAERFLDVLGRLEVEVFGEVRHRVPREAIVRVAPPIRLEERYEDYRANKRKVVAEVTQQMEDTIRQMLGELSKEASTPLALEA